MFLTRNFVVFFATFIFSIHLSAQSQNALDVQIEAEKLLAERAQPYALSLQATIEIQFKTSLADRIKDAPCKEPQAQIAPKSRPFGQTSVYIFCPQSSWNISIPVQVSLFAEVPVAATNLKRGQTVSAGDWISARIDVSPWSRGVTYNPAEIEGQTLSTNVRLGEPFPKITSSTDSAQGRSINAGDAVDIIIMGSGFSIQGRGTAMQSGSVGASIRIRTDSKNVLTGKVMPDGKVQVQMKD